MTAIRTLAAAATLGALFSLPVYAAQITPLSGPQDPSQLQATLNQVISWVNAGVPGFSSTFTGKNYLDNGDFFVAQRGTGAQVGGTTSGPGITAYGADRWAVDTNVGSGAGRSQIVTSSPSPPPGFQNVETVFRNSGALTQPILLEQEIESSRFTQLQGKPVILSCYLAALAGAPSGVTATMGLITGTGSNEGMGALRSAVGMTASPAITPALTGVALSASFTTPALTATMTRYSSGPIAVPLTATEGIFYVDFTPGAEAGGTTDGIGVTGCQLEQADSNQTTASAFEFLPAQYDLARAERFYWQIADPAATVTIPSACFVTAANTTVKCGVWLPVQMQTAPTTTVSVATSFGIVVTAGTAGTCTTLAATASSNSVNSIGVTCTTGGTIALGSSTPLIGAATLGTLTASADF